MRVKQKSSGYTVFLTGNEYSLMKKLVPNDVKAIWPELTSGEKRAWSRRIRRGEFLRVDQGKKV